MPPINRFTAGPGTFILAHRMMVAMVLGGSLMRLLFGFFTHLYNASPDQLAWQIVLSDAYKNGSSAWHQFLHYPHEGGTLLMSLLARAFMKVAFILPPLSWSALCFDTLSRYVQIRLAQRMWGSVTAAWFGCVAVLSGFPLMLPWATVNFGMHAAASFLPFVALALLSGGSTPLVLGVFTGMALSFSYDALVFIPVFIGALLFRKGRLYDVAHRIAGYGMWSLVAALPFLSVRYWGDTGFHLGEKGFWSIRGVEREAITWIESWHRFISTWTGTFPSSFFLNYTPGLAPGTVALPIMIVLLTGFILAIAARSGRSGSIYGVAVVFVFTIVYAVSPFFSPDKTAVSYVYYRHFAFIAPLSCALVFAGTSRIGKAGLAGSILIAAISLVFTVQYVRNTKPAGAPNYEAAGWVLGNKYGHDPVFLGRLPESTPEMDKPALIRGIGWGITAAVLQGREPGEEASNKRILLIFSKFDYSWQALLQEGFVHAFDEGITPKLNPWYQQNMDMLMHPAGHP